MKHCMSRMKNHKMKNEECRMKNNGKNGKERKNGKCSFSFHLMISEKKRKIATSISVFLNHFRFFRCYSSFGAKRPFFILHLITFLLLVSSETITAQSSYQMAGPYEVIARDGEFRHTKGGSERDMEAAFDMATKGQDSER